MRITTDGHHVADPPLARALFNSTAVAWVWLLVRFYVGYEWIAASLHKIGDPAWGFGNGTALLGFWKGAVAVPPTAAKAAITFDWYRSFLQYMIDNHAQTWFAPVVAYGELLVGVGIVVGAFTGIAAFFGALLNMNFMLAGSASTNPVLFFLAVGLMLAWKVAGYYGLDRVLLPLVGTPWPDAPAKPREVQVATTAPRPV
jgi:thiosulfate dehydrogenase [quinone] large subunit